MIKYLSLLFLILLPVKILAEEIKTYWPKQIEVDNFVITIYAPEPEKFEQNVLDGRAAFSLFDKQHLPVFGAMWFRCRVHTDVKNNEVYFSDIEVINVNFPNADAELLETFQTLIEEQAPSWSFNSDLKAFYKKAQVIDITNTISEEFRSHPPEIFYEKEPAFLVFIDGDPLLLNIDGSALYQYVVNTPHFIVKSTSDQQYYLRAGNWWYLSSDPTGSWKTIETPPNFIRQLAEKAAALNPEKTGAHQNMNGHQPKLIVTQEPAELIQTQGEPEISQIYENLFSVTNSNDEIIFDSYSDHYFILISGRWYKTKNLERGPWLFIAPEDLPEIFSEIPPSSPFAHLRLSVRGTPEAIAAALDNGIPQTAVVDRKTAKMTIDYDGEPQFEEIQGTSLKYGVNTGGSVIQSHENIYYAVDQGIWFMAESPAGPWKVADHYPEEVAMIPPSCPVFNMKFVHIYDYTDEIVHVGYTAGYLGAFLYHGVVYYGTGYRYKSWFGNKYIPRPTTYGYGASQKSSGTSNIQFYAAAGYGGPMMGVGFGGYPYGWGMGYGGYGMYNQMAYNQYYFAGQSVTVDHHIVEEKPIDLQNLYNNRVEGIIRTETALRNDPMKPVILNNREAVPNNLYADEKGNLYRQDEDGTWFEQQGESWVKTDKKIGN